jgi:hypothetical protein
MLHILMAHDPEGTKQQFLVSCPETRQLLALVKDVMD